MGAGPTLVVLEHIVSNPLDTVVRPKNKTPRTKSRTHQDVGMAEDGAIEMVLFSAGRVVARTSERFIGTTLGDVWHREGRCRTVNWWAERYPTQPPQRGSGRTPRRLSTEAAAPSIAAAASEAAAPTSTVAASWASWLRERRVDYYCSQVHPHPAVYDCLTVARFFLLSFCV